VLLQSLGRKEKRHDIPALSLVETPGSRDLRRAPTAKVLGAPQKGPTVGRLDDPLWVGRTTYSRFFRRPTVGRFLPHPRAPAIRPVSGKILAPYLRWYQTWSLRIKRLHLSSLHQAHTPQLRDKVSLDKYLTLYSSPFDVPLNISECFILPKIAIFRAEIHTFFAKRLSKIEIYLIKELCQPRHRKNKLSTAEIPE